jgi:hypothetical protein
MGRTDAPLYITIPGWFSRTTFLGELGQNESLRRIKGELLMEAKKWVWHVLRSARKPQLRQAIENCGDLWVKESDSRLLGRHPVIRMSALRNGIKGDPPGARPGVQSQRIDIVNPHENRILSARSAKLPLSQVLMGTPDWVLQTGSFDQR